GLRCTSRKPGIAGLGDRRCPPHGAGGIAWHRAAPRDAVHRAPSDRERSQASARSNLDWPLATHQFTPHRARKIATARKAQKRGTRARPVPVDMVWEQAPKKLSKCRYARATTQDQKKAVIQGQQGGLTPRRVSPLLPLSAGRMAALPQVLRVRQRGKSGLHGSTVPDNVRRGRPQGQCNRKQTALL